MMETKRIKRRTYDQAFKRSIVDECHRPEASVAAVAMAHGVNANLLHRWLSESKRELSVREPSANPVPVQREFIALPMPSVPVESPGTIRVEIQRGSTAVTITWPLQGAKDCADWLSDWLR